MKSIRPSSNCTFNCHRPNEIKLITRSTLGLSHLRQHKFRHNFKDTLNSICHRDYYLLPVNSPNHLDERATLLDNVQIIGENIHDKNDFEVSKLLLLGVTSNNHASNTGILNATIQYTLAAKRFEVPLTNS